MGFKYVKRKPVISGPPWASVTIKRLPQSAEAYWLNPWHTTTSWCTCAMEVHMYCSDITHLNSASMGAEYLLVPEKHGVFYSFPTGRHSGGGGDLPQIPQSEGNKGHLLLPCTIPSKGGRDPPMSGAFAHPAILNTMIITPLGTHNVCTCTWRHSRKHKMDWKWQPVGCSWYWSSDSFPSSFSLKVLVLTPRNLCCLHVHTYFYTMHSSRTPHSIRILKNMFLDL